MPEISPLSADTPSTALAYTIARATPHSGRYFPENILVDKPSDSTSRWSGALHGNHSNQWILLRLESLSVLKSISFGKLNKPHPCNMKECKVYVGITEESMVEVLHASLKNDATPETYAVKYTNNDGVVFPTRYVKIVPSISHVQNFHVSIWHISMTGVSDPAYVEKVLKAYEEYRETTVMKHILKHLRQRRLLTPYQNILARSALQLEHPLVTDLHSNIVINGNWKRAEQLLHLFSSSGLFNQHLSSCPPRAVWTRHTGTDADGDVPCARGGHATCIDPLNEMIYLFGGWDGQRSLDDFWVYSVREDKWKILSHSTAKEINAPGPRSCHKMVFDTKTGSIYLLGRLSDSDGATSSANLASHFGGARQEQGSDESGSSSTKSYCSEFYRYHTKGLDKGKWDYLSFDTASSHGPPLIFDHQMVMDCEAQILYVFGGRVVDGDWDSAKYSGLYCYNVRLSKWRLLQHPDTINGSQVIIPSRFGHSMVLEPNTKTLYIFAGQREDKYLSDMYAYDITTNNVTELFTNFTRAGGPDACFTQRAVIDPNLKEIYVFCGLQTRNSPAGSQATLRSYSSNWAYKYDTRPGKWTQILPEPERIGKIAAVSSPVTPPGELPVPRFAHQVVYNPNTRTAFMHGGNAGGLGLTANVVNVCGGRDADGDGTPDREAFKDLAAGAEGKERRLDDFWRMELKRPGAEEIIRRATFQIRRQQFREMCEEQPPIKALQFLQSEVSEVVDHSDAIEEDAFRSLLTHLLARPPADPSPPQSSSSTTPSHTPTLSTPPVSLASSKPPGTSAEGDEESDDDRPAKRSRTESLMGGTWTNRIGDNDSLRSSSSSRPSSLRDVRSMIDPVEVSAAHDDMPPSAERYRQRTGVFESILEFVSEADKQPVGNLLDAVGQDWGSATSCDY